MSCNWCHESNPINRKDGFCSDICKEHYFATERKAKETTENRPISQIYAEEGRAWAEAEALASILEDTKGPKLSTLILRLQEEEPNIAYNKAEARAKASDKYREWTLEAIEAREEANKLKVRLKSLEMAYGEWQSGAADERLQAKL